MPSVRKDKNDCILVFIAIRIAFLLTTYGQSNKSFVFWLSLGHNIVVWRETSYYVDQDLNLSLQLYPTVFFRWTRPDKSIN